MTKHITPTFIPPIIDNERFNMNGNVPSAAVMHRLASAFNFISGACKKQVFLKSQSLDAVAAGDPANVVWNGYFRTGHNTDSLRAVLGIALTDYGFASPPEVTLLVKDTGGSTILSPSWKFKASSAGTNVAPGELSVIHAITDADLSANTEYRFYFTCVNGARLVFASLTECDQHYADDSLTAVCDPGEFMAEGPIYDSHIADLVEANNELWQHNGAHLVNWCAPYDEDSTAPLISSTAYTNIIDITSTTVSAASPGWNLRTQYHNTVNRTTVPVKFCVNTDRTASTGTLDIKLTDGTNTISITGIGDVNGWSTTTANIPAQAGTKWDCHAKVSAGLTEFRVRAICLYEYEA